VKNAWHHQPVTRHVDRGVLPSQCKVVPPRTRVYVISVVTGPFRTRYVEESGCPGQIRTASEPRGIGALAFGAYGDWLSLAAAA
jgi:hypothetical protein